MRKFKKGDIVLCTKFSVEEVLVFGRNGMRTEPKVDKTFFDRKAFIRNTYKEVMDDKLGTGHEDKDEYEIEFLDNGMTLAWVSGDELTMILPF